jgi:ABC1 atypical kinase-like domain
MFFTNDFIPFSPSACVKKLFPEFEFTWLGEEMRENLPKELNFVHEASNAEHLASDFGNVSTSLYVPKVLYASKRVSSYGHVCVLERLTYASLIAPGHGVY